MQEGLNITSIEELKDYSNGSIVELPAFGEGQPFVARLKRPSMLLLVKSGKIPNALLIHANKMFEQGINGSFNAADDKAMEDMFGVLDAICEASFVQPTYKQLTEAGIELTDEQLMFVFGYAQNGVKQLESFR